MTVAVSLVGVVATVVSADAAAAFFGRPRFLAEPSVFAVALGIGAAFLTAVGAAGRPRFFAGEASFAAGAGVGVATTTGFFGDTPDGGRPRFFFAASLTFSGSC